MTDTNETPINDNATVTDAGVGVEWAGESVWYDFLGSCGGNGLTIIYENYIER